MATRSTIKIQGIYYAKVYKHFDGYPGNMMKWLIEFNHRFNQRRGHDAPYKFAQLLRYSSKYGREFKLGEDEFTGWGVVPYNDQCGEEYEYILTKDEVICKQR